MNSSVRWPDNTLPMEIYCAPGVLTGLEIQAADGLLAVPRIGLGVGGFLVGSRSAGRLEISRAVEIACSHALGPAFVLTPDELRASAAELNTSNEVVGWYCSKPGLNKTTALTMTERDLALFDVLCTEGWQVTLLIRPSMGHATTAAFGLRESGDSRGSAIRIGAERELAWQELAPYVVPGEPKIEAEIVEAQALELAPEEVEEVEVKAGPVETPLAPPVDLRVEMPGTFFGTEGPPDDPVKSSQWGGRLLIPALIVVALVVLALVLWRTA